MDEKFVALDFETADYGRDSACSLSLVTVQGTEIISQDTFLIRPPRKNFIFTYIHGITWDDVKKKPLFSELWYEISPLLEDASFLAAHNATFDKSVLNACCENAGLSKPKQCYLCTVKMARAIWGIFPTKLPDVCGKLDIALNHHDAASDALACAKIVIEAHKRGVELDGYIR